MKHSLLATTFLGLSLGLIAGCAAEPSAPSSTESEADQDLSAQPQTADSCPVPWEGPGTYFLCESTGVVSHNPTACRASCGGVPCEPIWHCVGNCICMSY